MTDFIRITYVRSAIGRNYHQKRVIRALGLRRLNYSRVLPDTPSIRGMINRVSHLLRVEPADEVEKKELAIESTVQGQQSETPEDVELESQETDASEEDKDA